MAYRQAANQIQKLRAGLLRRDGLRGIVSGVLLGGLMLSGASAQTPPVAATITQSERVTVMELYTSQGCAACPPADAMLMDLSARDDVIALALHVDYWDYIGWEDSFAQSAFSDRQKDYARRHGHSTIYTPQVILNGTEILEGFRVMSVMDALARHAQAAPEVTLTLAHDVSTGSLTINAVPMTDAAPSLALTSRRVAVPLAQSNVAVGSLVMPGADAQPASTAVTQGPAPFIVDVIRYIPSAQVDILSGENAGLTATYANIVTEWFTAAEWDMAEPLAMTQPLIGEEAVVVIVQERGLGEVIAAARLR